MGEQAHGVSDRAMARAVFFLGGGEVEEEPSRLSHASKLGQVNWVTLFLGEKCWTLFSVTPPPGTVEPVGGTLFREILGDLGGTVLTLVLPILL